MSGIFDIVQRQLKGGALQEIAERAGIDPATAQQAVNVALPKVLGGMAQHVSEPNNAQVIHAEADKYSSNAGVLGNLPNVFTGQGDAGGILGKVIGPRHEDIQNGVANATGIDKAKAAKVIGVLAPVILGAVALKKRQDGIQPHEVQSQLQQAQQQAQQTPLRATGASGVGGDTGFQEGPRA
jgi:hypothetical protein